MKKTLITLLALGSCAMGNLPAVTFDSSSITAGNQSIIIPDGKPSFTVAMTMDRDAIFSYLADGQNKSWNKFIIKVQEGNTYTGVYINGSSDSNGKITTSNLYASWGSQAWGPTKDANNNYIPMLWNGSEPLSDLKWDSIASVGFAYTHQGVSGASWSALAITMLDANGEVVFESYSKAPGLGVSSIDGGTISFIDAVATTYYMQSQSDEQTLKAYSMLAAKTAPIPEPATATLSLLALCGLAARRRRK